MSTHAWFQKRRPNALLGLAFDEARLHGAVVRRANGRLQVARSFTATLSLDPLASDPELVGREIRNILDKEGVRERGCAVAFPANWALVLQAAVPALPEADVTSFLNLEAERGFPAGLDTLLMRVSRTRASGGGQLATLVAVPRLHIARLESMLKAARLRPVSLSVGVSALQRQRGDGRHGVLALLVGQSTVDLQVACGAGVAALRSLKGVVERAGAENDLQDDVVAREIRITLGQLPGELREGVRTVRVFGRGDGAREFTEQLGARLETMGLSVEAANGYPADEFSLPIAPAAPICPELSLAAAYLTSAAPTFEFLPPKVAPWRQFVTRHSSKRLQSVGGLVGAVLLLGVGVFGWQEWQLVRLNAEWGAMSPRVRELEELQQQLKRFRPWADKSLPDLNVLRAITEAFPEDGAVSAKTLELRDHATVTCSGLARDNPALLKTLDQLRATRQISDVTVQDIQVRSGTPLQFSFTLRWQPGGSRED